jgi:hypothetical protein
MLESVGDRAVAASIHRRKVARAEPAIASALEAAQSIGRPRQLLLNLGKLDSHERPLVLSITDLRAVWPGCRGPSAVRVAFGGSLMVFFRRAGLPISRRPHVASHRSCLYAQLNSGAARSNKSPRQIHHQCVCETRAVQQDKSAPHYLSAEVAVAQRVYQTRPACQTYPWQLQTP